VFGGHRVSGQKTAYERPDGFISRASALDVNPHPLPTECLHVDESVAPPGRLHREYVGQTNHTVTRGGVQSAHSILYNRVSKGQG